MDGIQKIKSVTQDSGEKLEKGGKTARRAGAVMQTGGKALEASGKAAEIGGRGLQAGGKALEGTRVGAVVGAPMEATGTALRTGGKGAQTIGRSTSRAGQTASAYGIAGKHAGSKLKSVGGRDKQKSEGEKIKKTDFAWMLTVALIADGISAAITFIPLIGQIINPIFSFFFALTFWLWFAFKGLGFYGGMGGGASMIIELIPAIQALPPFTAMVVARYLKEKGVGKAAKVAGHIGPAGKIADKALKKSA